MTTMNWEAEAKKKDRILHVVKALNMSVDRATEMVEHLVALSDTDFKAHADNVAKRLADIQTAPPRVQTSGTADSAPQDEGVEKVRAQVAEYLGEFMGLGEDSAVAADDEGRRNGRKRS